MQTDQKELTQILQDIQVRLKSVEEKISKSSAREVSPNTIHLHVQEVNIQTLQLEELAYHLDKIDIKELSGMLNLGNTFSPSASPKSQKSRQKSTKPTTENMKPSPVKKKDHSSPNEKESIDANKEANRKINIMVNGKTVNPKLN